MLTFCKILIGVVAFLLVLWAGYVAIRVLIDVAGPLGDDDGEETYGP